MSYDAEFDTVLALEIILSLIVIFLLSGNRFEAGFWKKVQPQ